MSEIMNIAQIRVQLKIADKFARAGISFVVVPITTAEERIALARQALKKIDEIQGEGVNDNDY